MDDNQTWKPIANKRYIGDNVYQSVYLHEKHNFAKYQLSALLNVNNRVQLLLIVNVRNAFRSLPLT